MLKIDLLMVIEDADRYGAEDSEVEQPESAASERKVKTSSYVTQFGRLLQEAQQRFEQDVLA